MEIIHLIVVLLIINFDLVLFFLIKVWPNYVGHLEGLTLSLL